MFNKIFTKKNPLILASKSPQRKKILKMLKINFEIIPSNEPEIIDQNLSPEKVAESLALQKAKAIAKKNPNKYILGIDTLVVSKTGIILGKPKSKKEALKMILEKSENKETIISGIALIKNEKIIVQNEKTIVCFGKISNNNANWLLEQNEWQGRSGGFSVEGRSSIFISGIEGCFWNVVGLPVFRFFKLITDKKNNYNYSTKL